MSNYSKKLEYEANQEERYIIEKAIEYQENLKFDKSGDGWNDTLDGFRHVWGSAYLSLKYGSAKAHAATFFHEVTVRNQDIEERRMDEWNNKIGRDIADKIRKDNKNIENDFSWSHIEDLIAVKTLEKIREKEVITSTSDKRVKNTVFYNKSKFQKKGSPTGYAANIEDDEGFEQEVDKLSFRDRLLKAREEKLAYYTARLAEDPEKVKEREAKHVSLDDLKALQEEKKQKVRDIIEGKVQFDANQDISAYENKKLGSNKIFTQEEIDSMSDEDKQKNKAAIFYQKQTIGVPTEEQAKKAVSKGGMVFVNGYTRSDGTKVKSYYRSR